MDGESMGPRWASGIVRRSKAELTWARRAFVVIVELQLRRTPCHSLSESGFGPTTGGDGTDRASAPPCSREHWAATQCSRPTCATIGCKAA